MAHSDADRTRHARIYGVATPVRDAIRLNHDANLDARHRAEWPNLWDRIDALIAKVTHTP